MPTTRASPCVIIQGGDEKTKGEVQIKDLVLGAEIRDALSKSATTISRNKPRRSSRCRRPIWSRPCRSAAGATWSELGVSTFSAYA